MNYTIENKYKIISEHGSKGQQEKYYRNGYWYKLDSRYNEGRIEHIVSVILKHSNITDFVFYNTCKVNNKNACRSKTFLSKNEIFLTLETILCDVYGLSSADNYVYAITNVKDRFDCLVDAVKKYTNNQLNITSMLQIILYLDLLILNRDRHLNNIGIIVDVSNGSYRTAPIFDNGLSLLGGLYGEVYNYGLPAIIQKQSARTISGSFVNQVLAATNNVLKSPLKINFNAVFNELKREETSDYILNVLSYQYNQLGSLYE